MTHVCAWPARSPHRRHGFPALHTLRLDGHVTAQDAALLCGLEAACLARIELDLDACVPAAEASVALSALLLARPRPVTAAKAGGGVGGRQPGARAGRGGAAAADGDGGGRLEVQAPMLTEEGAGLVRAAVSAAGRAGWASLTRPVW